MGNFDRYSPLNDKGNEFGGICTFQMKEMNLEEYANTIIYPKFVFKRGLGWNRIGHLDFLAKKYGPILTNKTHLWTLPKLKSQNHQKDCKITLEKVFSWGLENEIEGLSTGLYKHE